MQIIKQIIMKIIKIYQRDLEAKDGIWKIQMIWNLYVHFQKMKKTIYQMYLILRKLSNKKVVIVCYAIEHLLNIKHLLLKRFIIVDIVELLFVLYVLKIKEDYQNLIKKDIEYVINVILYYLMLISSKCIQIVQKHKKIVWLK